MYYIEFANSKGQIHWINTPAENRNQARIFASMIVVKMREKSGDDTWRYTRVRTIEKMGVEKDKPRSEDNDVTK